MSSITIYEDKLKNITITINSKIIVKILNQIKQASILATMMNNNLILEKGYTPICLSITTKIQSKRYSFPT